MKREKPKARAPLVDQRLLRRHIWVGAVILFTLLAYVNSFHTPLLLDNDEAILQDTRVHAATAENVGRILGRPYHQAFITNLYRPFTTLSYWFNYAVLGYGPAPDGYHRFNFLIHAVNVALVYSLGIVLFEETAAALALAALWGVHPILTDAVTNIVGRADMLAAFGTLASVLGYRASLRSEGARRRVWLAAVAIAAGIGVCSKESGVVSIAALAVYDLLYERSAPARARLEGYAAVALPLAAFFVARARVLGRFPAAPFPFTDNPLIGTDFFTARISAIGVIGKYIGLLLWPARLSPDYSYREIPAAITAGAFVALVGCVAALGLAAWSWRRNRTLAFSILFFFVCFAPVSNVFLLIGSVMAERFLYLPSVGFFAAIVWGLVRLRDRKPALARPLMAAVVVVLLLLAGRVNARNGDWSDNLRFWRSAVEASPSSYKTLINDAAVAMNTANTAQAPDPADRRRALAEADRTLAILDPLPDRWNTGVAYRVAGVVYREQGEMLALRKIEPDGTEPSYWYNKSLDALLHSERIERALDETYRELNGRRGTPRQTFLPASIYLELGRTFLRLNRLDDARRVLEFGHTLESNADLLEALGALYESFAEWRRAAQAYVEALEVDSSRGRLNQKLTDVYAKADPSGCAVQRQAGAPPALNLQCPMVHADICGAARSVAANFQRRDQTEDAESIKRTALSDLGCTEDTLR